MHRAFRPCSVFLASSLICPSVSLACIPGSEYFSATQELHAADAVFIGRLVDRTIIKMKCVDDSPEICDGERVRVLVLKAWKGPRHAGDIAVLNNSFNPWRGGCYDKSFTNDPEWLLWAPGPEGGTPPAISDTWLLYVWGDEPWRVSLASRSVPADFQSAVDDIKELDRATGSPPTVLPTSP